MLLSLGTGPALGLSILGLPIGRRSSGQVNVFIHFSSVLLGLRDELVFCVELGRCCPGCSFPLGFVTWDSFPSPMVQARGES